MNDADLMDGSMRPVDGGALEIEGQNPSVMGRYKMDYDKYVF